MNDLILFQNAGGGGGTGASDFLKDNFPDTTRAPILNTGFSSTVLKNPFNKSFLDDDAPKYSAKTLWIKDLALLDDRTQWINNLPTYEVIFSEQYPGVYCYCSGNIRIKTFAQGKTIDILNIDNIFGCTGVMRRVSFILNSTDQASGTADILVDGVDTTNDVSFGNSPISVLSNGYNKFNAFPHASANETKDIHDYRLTANEYGTLSVAGLVVYYENATTDIDIFPGNTYIDKTLASTTGITHMALATAERNGARTVIYKTSGAYNSSTVNTPINYTLGSGTSGAGTINVTTGQGASYPAGTAVVVPQGASFYVGTVTSVSTDTLTVAPVLPFNLAAGSTMWNLHRSGPTLPIGQSLYKLAYTVELASSSVFGNVDGFNITSPNDNYWQHPEQNYRVWGDALNIGSVNGNYGVYWNGVSLGFLQVDGYFSAAEIEFAGGSGILHATLTINGLNGYGINEGFTGIAKKTVFAGSPGWNSFVFSPGASIGNVFITKVNLYHRRDDINVTLGVLADYETLPTKIFRPAINATLAQFGTYRRVYADSLYLNGHWIRGATHTAAGGIFATGSSTTTNITFYYYGKDYALIGTGGASTAISIDGGGNVLAVFNAFTSVSTEGFHKLSISNASSQTLVINAIDYTRTVAAVSNKQMFQAVTGLTNIPQVYNQTDTPRKHIDGSVWMRDKYKGDLWIWFGDRFYSLQTFQQSEDPNSSVILMYGGNT